jgi:hypothetical protein
MRLGTHANSQVCHFCTFFLTVQHGNVFMYKRKSSQNLGTALQGHACRLPHLNDKKLKFILNIKFTSEGTSFTSRRKSYLSVCFSVSMGVGGVRVVTTRAREGWGSRPAALYG